MERGKGVMSEARFLLNDLYVGSYKSIGNIGIEAISRANQQLYPKYALYRQVVVGQYGILPFHSTHVNEVSTVEMPGPVHGDPIRILVKDLLNLV